MSRYIIKNCEQIHSSDNFCWSKNVHCQDCTDCVMKQIVGICGKYHVIDAGFQKLAINYLSSDILKLLDIQEVE